MTQAPYFSTLQNRGLVKVSGADARGFLQGLISNDITLLDKQPCVYACLLTAQGKFLHDFFITEKAGVIFLECEGGARAEDLARRLTIYKLRANVKIECEKTIPVYALFFPPPLWGEGRGGGAAQHVAKPKFLYPGTPPPYPPPKGGRDL